ncbi:hypothetical protein Tco_0826732 [Tanacetum coccineum]
MKEKAYNKEQRDRPIPHELNDESNLIDLMKECLLTTRPACHSSLVSCLSLLGESLPSMPYVSGQYLKALPSQSAVSESESRVPDAVSE